MGGGLVGGGLVGGGASDGMVEGTSDGETEGSFEGASDGMAEGAGENAGAPAGASDGMAEGEALLRALARLRRRRLRLKNVLFCCLEFAPDSCGGIVNIATANSTDAAGVISVIYSINLGHLRRRQSKDGSERELHDWKWPRFVGAGEDKRLTIWSGRERWRTRIMRSSRT